MTICKAVFPIIRKSSHILQFSIYQMSRCTLPSICQSSFVSTIARHLCPSRYAGLHKVTYHILVNKIPVHLRMVKHVGTWAYNTHIAFEHIEELRQLVNIRLTHEITESKFTRVILCCLHKIGIFVDMHGTELIALEFTTVHTRAGLFEKIGPGLCNLIIRAIIGINGSRQSNITDETARSKTRLTKRFVGLLSGSS